MRFILPLYIVLGAFTVTGCKDCCFMGPGDRPDPAEITSDGSVVSIKTKSFNWVLYGKLTNFAEANEFCDSLSGYALSATPAIEIDIAAIFQQSQNIGKRKPAQSVWSASDQKGELILSGTYSGMVETVTLQETVAINTIPSDDEALPLCVEVKSQE